MVHHASEEQEPRIDMYKHKAWTGALRIRSRLYTGYVAIWEYGSMRLVYTARHKMSIEGRRKIINKYYQLACSINAAQ
jgi:hypothetical protein